MRTESGLSLARWLCLSPLKIRWPGTELNDFRGRGICKLQITRRTQRTARTGKTVFVCDLCAFFQHQIYCIAEQKGQLGVRQQLHPGGIDDPHPREQSGCESSVRSSEAATPHPFAAGFVPDLSRVLVLDTTRSVGKAVSVCLMPPNFSPGLVT